MASHLRGLRCSGLRDHTPLELDAFVRLQEGGMSFEEAQACCLAEQGLELIDACETAKKIRHLFSHEILALFAALSQSGYARYPIELLVLVRLCYQFTA